MQAFDEVHRAIHFPPDRRFRVWINPWFVFVFAVVALAPVAIAWGQYLIASPASAGIETLAGVCAKTGWLHASLDFK